MRKRIRQLLSKAQPIPPIQPLYGNTDRPLWSVMIPVHNESDYMVQALSSVLAQDPGPQMMQIQVVDDASKDPSIRERIYELANERVEYYRIHESKGQIHTFNTCLNHSRGHLVQVLHADDQVEEGFYKTLQSAFEDPRIVAAFCRSRFVDEYDTCIAYTGVEQPQAGIMPHFLSQITRRHFVLPCSMVVRRQAYERIGGYWPAISAYEEWDLYKRVAMCGAVWYEPTALCRYRLKSSSLTEIGLYNFSIIISQGMSIEMFRHYLSFPVDRQWSDEAWEEVRTFAINVARLLVRRHETALAWRYALYALQIRFGVQTLMDFLRLLKLQLYPVPASIRLAIDHSPLSANMQRHESKIEDE